MFEQTNIRTIFIGLNLINDMKTGFLFLYPPLSFKDYITWNPLYCVCQVSEF